MPRTAGRTSDGLQTSPAHRPGASPAPYTPTRAQPERSHPHQPPRRTAQHRRSEAMLRPTQGRPRATRGAGTAPQPPSQRPGGAQRRTGQALSAQDQGRAARSTAHRARRPGAVRYQGRASSTSHRWEGRPLPRFRHGRGYQGHGSRVKRGKPAWMAGLRHRGAANLREYWA